MMFNKEKITAFLRNPFVDKILGIIAVLPVGYVVYAFLRSALVGDFNIYTAAIAANISFYAVFVVFRRSATRISLDPVFWLVTAVRTYWAHIVLKYLYVTVATNDIQLFIAHTLFFLSLAIFLYARASLGRNIGLVPARRELVTSGAYGYVRHPIHAGELVFFVSYMLNSFTALNVSLLMIGVVFVIWKSLIEERFLKDDADYREYCQRVRWRWIPGVI
jgi:protein-S-isoprenylcysteine O-methyltransferase Ste14